MDNLASHKYETEIDKKVKEELEIAGIPVFKLPAFMNTEVKTKYVGILNGFFFYRAWTYWICEGDMPLDDANYIYNNFKDLLIRAGGDAGNDPPILQSYNKEHIAQLKHLRDSLPIAQYFVESKKVVEDKTLPRFVGDYHIDTQLGLCKLAQTIKDGNIHTELRMGSYLE